MPDRASENHPATITITQEGEPLGDADVFLFSLDDPSSRWIINGRTDSSGNAQLFTLAGAQIRRPGAPEGRFKVTVARSVADEVPSQPLPREPAEVHRAYREQLRQNWPHTHHFVEEQYMFSDTSPLEVTIERKRNTLTLNAGQKTRWSVPMQL